MLTALAIENAKTKQKSYKLSDSGGLHLLPNDNDVGHAAGELAKSVTIAATNPVGAVHGLFHQLWRGFR